jgi:hypothetical protein
MQSGCHLLCLTVATSLRHSFTALMVPHKYNEDPLCQRTATALPRLPAFCQRPRLRHPCRSRMFDQICSSDLDAQSRTLEHGGVLVAVQQGLPDQTEDSCPKLPLSLCRSLGPPSRVILMAGQQVPAVSRGGQRQRVLGVAPCPHGTAPSGQRMGDLAASIATLVL